MAENKKAHDGFSVVEHYVQPGQTLSSIAKQYRLPNYRGLWVYNTQIRRSLTTSGPDVIPTGRRILIPRTPVGYAKWIAEIRQLRDDTHDIVAAARLDEIEAEAGMLDVKLDFISDVLTLIGTLAVKGTQAAKAAGLAFDEKIAEEAVVNARLGYLESLLDLDSSANSLFARFESMMAAAKKTVRNSAAEKLFDKIAGKELALVRKLLKAASTVKGGGIKMALGAIADSTKAMLEFTDYLKPSRVRRVLMIRFLGESLDGTLADQRSRLRKAEEDTRARLECEIHRIEEEQKLVWG